jgi:hypothetical protein
MICTYSCIRSLTRYYVKVSGELHDLVFLFLGKKRPTLINRLGGPQRGEKYLTPVGIRTTIFRIFSPWSSQYTD